MMLALILLAATVGRTGAVETPSMAVLLAAADVGGERSPALNRTTFDALPRPGTGMSFTAEARRPSRRSLKVVVRAWFQGRLVKEVEYSLPWRASTKVVTLKRPVAKGALIRRADVTVQPYDGPRPGLYLATVSDAVGKVARTALANGARVRRNSVREPYLVKRGEVVKLLVRSGRLTVSVTATALGSGGAGQRVLVQNGRSDKNIEATVVRRGEVEVRFR